MSKYHPARSGHCAKGVTSAIHRGLFVHRRDDNSHLMVLCTSSASGASVKPFETLSGSSFAGHIQGASA